MFTHDRLKDRHREIRDGLPQAVSLRIHRQGKPDAAEHCIDRRSMGAHDLKQG